MFSVIQWASTLFYISTSMVFLKQFLYPLDYIILNKKGQKSVDYHSNLYLCIQQPFSELIVFYSLLIHYNRR